MQSSLPRYDHRVERTWPHLDTMQFKTFLICLVPRVDCKDHKIKSLQVPWADMRGRSTMLFERFAIDVLQSANNKKKAAELLGLS
jgi:transposase